MRRFQLAILKKQCEGTTKLGDLLQEGGGLPCSPGVWLSLDACLLA